MSMFIPNFGLRLALNTCFQLCKPNLQTTRFGPSSGHGNYKRYVASEKFHQILWPVIWLLTKWIWLQSKWLCFESMHVVVQKCITPYFAKIYYLIFVHYIDFFQVPYLITNWSCKSICFVDGCWFMLKYSEC